MPLGTQDLIYLYMCQPIIYLYVKYSAQRHVRPSTCTTRVVHISVHQTEERSEVACQVLSSLSSVFCPRAGPSLQTQAPRLQFCPKAGLPLQTREPRLQFHKGSTGAVASRCFPHPTLSLASEQTLKDLKRSQGTNEEMRKVDLANWALRTSPKCTTGVKYRFRQGFFLPDQRSGNPNHPSSPLPSSLPI